LDNADAQRPRPVPKVVAEMVRSARLGDVRLAAVMAPECARSLLGDANSGESAA
jgi:hypothetical protein